jgi:hypothetical protein
VTPIMGFAARSVRGPTPIAQSISSFGSKSVRLEDGARVGQVRAAIYEQRTPLERAGAAFARALTDEGLMSQEYLRRLKRGLRSSCSRLSHDSSPRPARSSQPTGRST